jgi:hypothetical protein
MFRLERERDTRGLLESFSGKTDGQKMKRAKETTFNLE